MTAVTELAADVGTSAACQALYIPAPKPQKLNATTRRPPATR